jgi:hypothetical protein
LWQGIYFSVLAGVVLLLGTPLLGGVFDWAGHEPAVRQNEVLYASVLMAAACPSC